MLPVRPLLALLAAAVLCGVLAPAAAGAPVVVREIVEGPVVAGDGIVWVELRRGRLELRSADLRGGDRRLLARLGGYPEDAHGRFTRVSLSGAPDGYVAVVLTDEGANRYVPGENGGPATDTVLAGGRREAPWTVASCDRRTFEGREVRFADRAPGAIASAVRACGRGPATLDIRSPAVQGEPVRRLPPVGGSLGANHFAYMEEASDGLKRIVVLDWRRNEVAYTVSLNGIADDDTRVTEVEAGDDGRVAFALTRSSVNGDVGPAGAWTASAEDPRPVRLTTVGGTLNLSGGTLAFLRYGRGPSGAEVVTYDLAHGRESVLTTGVGIPTAGRGLDFQGGTLAWRTAACAGSVLRVGRVGRRTPAWSDRPCRLRLDRRPLVGAGSAIVAYRCTGYAYYGCAGRVTLRTPDGAGRLLARGRGSTDLSGEDRYERTELRLTPLGRRLLPTHPGMRVRVTVTNRDDAGRLERRSTRARVERRSGVKRRRSRAARSRR